MEPRARASPEQFSVLIDFMERRGDISRPQQGPQGRIKSDKLWQELTSLLNSLGGGVQRTSDKWRKVWTDWKTKTKKNYLNLRQHSNGTGGGPSNRMVLTTLEERVVALIGVAAVVGQAGIQEQGFNRTISEPTPDAGSGIEEEEIEIMLEPLTHYGQNSAVALSPAISSSQLMSPRVTAARSLCVHRVLCACRSSLTSPPSATSPVRAASPTSAASPASAA